MHRNNVKNDCITLLSTTMTNPSAPNPKEEERIFAEQSQTGYTLCFAEQCPKREQCLHWRVGQHLTGTRISCHCINLLYPEVATENCPCFRSKEKVKFAKGMTGTFTDDMPLRVVKYVRHTLIARQNRAYYFEYRNGKRLIHPTLQEEIRALFRQAGWNGEVKFDGYIEDYDW